MTFEKRPLQTIVLIWAAWVAIMLGYQTLVSGRIAPQRPDYSREWTPDFTTENSLADRLYLNEPFMNRQVAWDSEYYLSISIAGYDDPNAPFARLRSGHRMPLNYAFFPLYPALIGVLAVPLRLFGMNPIATAALAGVLVSALGTLVGMIALYLLARDELQAAGGVRAAFYLLVFPTGFFLAQVYTEGLFVGLAFASLALMQHKRLLWAGIVAALAVWTRSVGLALLVPLALAWLNSLNWRRVRQAGRAALPPVNVLFANTLALLLPVAAYLDCRHVLGRQFDLVQDIWFGRGLLDVDSTFSGWRQALQAISDGDNTQMRIYYLLELSAVLVALFACLLTLRRYPGIALFGLLALAVAFFSGSPQSLIRYVLVIPSIYLLLAQWGRHAVVDRVWTLASVLLLGLLTYLFTFDMWAA